MIVCSHCLHHNLDEASYCEACGSKLPELSSCSNCGSPVLDKAHFCGGCGFNLQLSSNRPLEPVHTKGTGSDVILPMPFPPEPTADLSIPATAFAPAEEEDFKLQTTVQSISVNTETQEAAPSNKPAAEVVDTQIQTQSASLLHAQSNSLISLTADAKSVIHIGKPNDRVPPDINVSVFSSAEVVSRIHAAIHHEEGHFFVEDVGSANGTYLNNMPLTPSTRYRLRVGDRITLGKGELMTFIFKMN
jgi:pSer/pThr/pTyr-binding forkhead associated (FHA) protein